MTRFAAPTALLVLVLASGCSAIYPYATGDGSTTDRPRGPDLAPLPDSATRDGARPPLDALPPPTDSPLPLDALPPPADAPPPLDALPPPADSPPPPDVAPPPADAPPPPDVAPPPADTQPPPDVAPPPADTQPPPDVAPPPADAPPADTTSPPDGTVKTDALDCPTLAELYASTLVEAKRCQSHADCTTIVDDTAGACCVVYVNKNNTAEIDLLLALKDQSEKLGCPAPCPMCVAYSRATCDGMGMNKTCVDHP